MELATKGVAMECKAENFGALFERVHRDLMEASGHDPAADQTAAARRPRALPDGSREFFVGGRWVRKVLQPEKTEAQTADKRKYKCLVRRPSDEAGHPKTRKGKGGRAGILAAGTAEVSAGSSLGLDLELRWGMIRGDFVSDSEARCPAAVAVNAHYEKQAKRVGGSMKKDVFRNWAGGIVGGERLKQFDVCCAAGERLWEARAARTGRICESQSNAASS